MASDWLLTALGAVERTAEDAAFKLGEVHDRLDPVRADRLAGVALPIIATRLATEGGEARREIAASFHAYEHAVASLRAQVVRALVDDEGATLSELARRMGLSRQAVGRLYEAGATGLHETLADTDQGP